MMFHGFLSFGDFASIDIRGSGFQGYYGLFVLFTASIIDPALTQTLGYPLN